MKKILVSTYAVNPYKGSEDGMGWNFILQIARFNKVYAITRENNQEAIEQYMAEHKDTRYANIEFLYYDLPYWMRFWKKGGRGAMLYYYMWQRGIVSFIKNSSIEFDLTHNLNFHNDWTPSFLWKLGKPFIWGPVGHHPIIPKQYLQPYSKKYIIKDRLTWFVKKLFWNYSKGLKNTVRYADHIFCMNSEAAKSLKLSEEQYSIMPSVATEDQGFKKKSPHGRFNILSAGRLVPLKGFDLTIRSFAKFYHMLPKEQQKTADLTIVGKGPELDRLMQIAKEARVEHAVNFIDWIEREKLMELYKEASVYLFPSHEGAGMVVAEALSFALPVICLNNSGPGEFINKRCGIAVNQTSYRITVHQLSEALLNLYSSHNLYTSMSSNARICYQENFHWDRRGEQIQNVYLNFLKEKHETVCSPLVK